MHSEFHIRRLTSLPLLSFIFSLLVQIDHDSISGTIIDPNVAAGPKMVGNTDPELNLDAIQQIRIGAPSISFRIGCAGYRIFRFSMRLGKVTFHSTDFPNRTMAAKVYMLPVTDDACSSCRESTLQCLRRWRFINTEGLYT